MKLGNLLRRDPTAPTLRERATALREGLSRREAVIGTAAAITAAPLPVAAASATVAHPDAVLIALWQRREAANEEWLSASDRLEAAHDAHHSVEWPEALGVQLGDGDLGLARLAKHEREGRTWYWVGNLDADAAQTALDAADKIIAALDRLDGLDAPQGIEAAPDPRPATEPTPLAQIVRLGDLGEFRTIIPRTRATREESPVPPVQEPETADPAPESEADDAKGFATDIARPREEAAEPEIRATVARLPWGGAGNVVAAAGCAVLAFVGLSA